MTPLLLSAALSLLAQDDPVVEQFEKTILEARKKKDSKQMEAADKMLADTLAAYDAAVKNKDEVARKREGIRLHRMLAILNVRLPNEESADLERAVNFVRRLVELNAMDDKAKIEAQAKARQAVQDVLQQAGVKDGIRSLLPQLKDNSAALYEKAFKLKEELAGKAPVYDTIVRDRAAAIQHQEAGKKFLEVYAPILPIIRQATEKGPALFSVNYEDGPAAELKHITGLIGTQKILQHCALAKSALNEHREARDLVRLQFKVATCNAHEPLLISALVSTVLQTIAVHTLQEICGGELPPADELDEFARALEELPTTRMYEVAMKGEVWFAFAGVQLILEVSPDAGIEMETIFYEDIVHAMRSYLKMAELFAKSHADVQKTAKDLQTAAERFPYLSHCLVPAAAESAKSLVDLQTRIDVTRLGIAALKYKQKNGALPAGLDVLAPEYIKAVPRDRFTGGDLRYEKNRIWSPGTDSTDQDDIVFEFK